MVYISVVDENSVSQVGKAAPGHFYDTTERCVPQDGRHPHQPRQVKGNPQISLQKQWSL